jgi:dolichyl-phosphate beta-glucosyltransferase
MKTPEISLIIPAYNEEDRIGLSLRQIADFANGYPRDIEVLTVDDGSSDKTAEIVARFVEENSLGAEFSLLLCEKNSGKGHAVRRGFAKARGRYVLFSDTDLSAPIEQIPLLVEALEGGADVAIASRRLPESEVVGLPFRRALMGRFFAWISRCVVLPGYTDTQCGFKAYRAEAAKALAERQSIDGYTFDVEHLLWARRLGLKVAEVPVRWVYTEGSKINSFFDSFKMLRDLLVLRRKFSRMGAETN